MNSAINICPICNSSASYIFTSQHERKIFSCSNFDCQHLFTPQLSPTQGVHDRPIDIENQSNKTLQIYEERNQRLLNLFLESLPNKSKNSKYTFLDFGAGVAHISRTFKSVLNDRVVIYCVEEEEKCKALYSKYDLQYRPTLENIHEKVDLIYAIEVIEHLADPITILEKFRNILSKNGKIFLSTPAGHVSEKRTNAYKNSTHLHFFTPLSLNIALSKAGFESIDYKYFSEMYPRRKQQSRKIFTKSIVHPIYKHAKNLFISTMKGIPSSLDGKMYPYHLVGFSRPLGIENC